MSGSSPHSGFFAVDWAETLRGHIILNIDEPWKTPALRALDEMVEQYRQLGELYNQKIDRIEELVEQVEALREECADWERGADEELARAWKERALRSEEQLEALADAIDGADPRKHAFEYGGGARAWRHLRKMRASIPASVREEVRAIEGPLSPDELEEVVTRALDSFGGSNPASRPS